MLVSVEHDLGAIEIDLIGLETACDIWVDAGIVVQGFGLQPLLFFGLDFCPAEVCKVS